MCLCLRFHFFLQILSSCVCLLAQHWTPSWWPEAVGNVELRLSKGLLFAFFFDKSGWAASRGSWILIFFLFVLVLFDQIWRGLCFAPKSGHHDTSFDLPSQPNKGAMASAHSPSVKGTEVIGFWANHLGFRPTCSEVKRSPPCPSIWSLKRMLCSRTEKTKKPEKEPGVRKNVSLARYPRETYTIVVMILVGGRRVSRLSPLTSSILMHALCIHTCYARRPRPTRNPRPPPPKKTPPNNFWILKHFQVIKNFETGNKTRNYLDGPKNNSPGIFGR